MRSPKVLFFAVMMGAGASSSAAGLRSSAGQAAVACPFSSNFPLHFVSSSPYHPANLRRHYELAAADKSAGEKFYKLLADYKDRDGLVLAYKGASEAIRARDASMFNKLTYVQDAAKTFEQAVSIDPQNPEIRFLRFSVESNLPPFLGLSKHMEEDKEMLLNAALSHPKSGLDAESFRTVRSFLVDRGHVSEGDAQKLNKVKE
jgi:hypothetical protein